MPENESRRERNARHRQLGYDAGKREQEARRVKQNKRFEPIRKEKGWTPRPEGKYQGYNKPGGDVIAGILTLALTAGWFGATAGEARADTRPEAPRATIAQVTTEQVAPVGRGVAFPLRTRIAR